jgi:hypothetical protein
MYMMKILKVFLIFLMNLIFDTKEKLNWYI